MNIQSEALSNDLKKDIERNRDGRLSSRQWLQLITEPLTTLLLLTVPLILLVGRFGIAGRWIVLIVIAAFAVTILFRAVRFSRLRLHYRIVFAENLHPRWKFWRKLNLITRTGEPIRFDSNIATNFNIEPDQPLMVYYVELADRRVLVSTMPEKHPKALSAQPTQTFKYRDGIIHTD